jgi:signal transduction histidine kinase
VRMFAEHLNGRLSFDSTLGKGSTAVLELPAPVTCEMESGNASA